MQTDATVSLEDTPVGSNMHSGAESNVQHSYPAFGLKVVRKKLSVNFSPAEASKWWALNHPNLIPFLGLVHLGHYYYVTLPLLETTLSEYLTLYPSKDATTFIPGIADALAYLHRVDVVHGDVQPSNIFIRAGSGTSAGSDDSQSVVLGAIATSHPGSEGFEKQGLVAWVAPELLGRPGGSISTLTKASDMYSFGATVYNIITRSVPYVPPSSPSLVKEVECSGTEVEVLSPVYRRCLSRDPTLRPSISQITEVLRGQLRIDCSTPPWLSVASMTPTSSSTSASEAAPGPTKDEFVSEGPRPIKAPLVGGTPRHDTPLPFDASAGQSSLPAKVTHPTSPPIVSAITEVEPKAPDPVASLSRHRVRPPRSRASGGPGTWTFQSLMGIFSSSLFSNTTPSVDTSCGGTRLDGLVLVPRNHVDISRDSPLDEVEVVRADTSTVAVVPPPAPPAQDSYNDVQDFSCQVKRGDKGDLADGDERLYASRVLPSEGQTLISLNSMEDLRRTSFQSAWSQVSSLPLPETLYPQDGPSKSTLSSHKVQPFGFLKSLIPSFPFRKLTRPFRRLPHEPILATSHTNDPAAPVPDGELVDESQEVAMRQGAPAPGVSSIVPLTPHPGPDVPDVMAMLTTDMVADALRHPHEFGGFASIYRLQAPDGHGILALKCLRNMDVSAQQNQERSKHEARTWYKLKHPNILPFYGIFQYDGESYLVSPFMKNGSLKRYLGHNPWADRVRFVLETVSGLAFMHTQGVIHGDLKASNILVSDSVVPRALLCDFGLTREAVDVTVAWLEGAGALQWQGPELLVASGSPGKTYATDMWALGMTIYEILSGKTPFEEWAQARGTLFEMISSGATPEPIPSHSIDGVSYERLWSIASRCWMKDPTRRISSSVAYDLLFPLSLRSRTSSTRSLPTEAISIGSLPQNSSRPWTVYDTSTKRQATAEAVSPDATSTVEPAKKGHQTLKARSDSEFLFASLDVSSARRRSEARRRSYQL